MKKSTTTTTSKKTMSKADFVRRFPDASAAEVIAAAKKAGMKLSIAYVYNVRTKANTAAAAKKPAKKKALAAEHVGTVGAAKTPVVEAVAKAAGLQVETSAGGPGPAKAKPSVEQVFLACLAELGAERAERIIHDSRAALRQITGTGE